MQPTQLWKNRDLTATKPGPWLRLLLGIACVIALVRHSPVRLGRFAVLGPSMEPALIEGDRLLVLRGSSALLRPRPGTVVLARSPAAPDRDVVKRIGAVFKEQGRTRYVLLGDNRAASTDSRQFGPVPASAVRGRVLYRYWPDERRGPVR